MKIIILGAGQVGASLARHLAEEKGNSVNIIDKNEETLNALRETVDVGTIVGHGAYPDVLALAGAEDADMLIAVTNNDESNMLACQVAYTVFQTPTKIARIRSDAFSSCKALFDNAAIPIDVLISPEQLVTSHIEKLIAYPGTLQVLDFSTGGLQLVVVIAESGGLLTGETISALHERLTDVTFKVAAVYRRGKSLHLEEKTFIRPNDEVFFVATKKHIKKLIAAIREQGEPNRRITIAGGGNVGARTATILENSYQVKVIDHHPSRCQHLAEKLNSGLVLVGDCTDKQLLQDEYIEDTDVFCALTQNDETNIMSSILAKRLGAKKSMALINHLSYVELVEGGEIDIVISPQQVTVSYLLKHIRRGDIVKVHTLRHDAEILEAIVHGDEENSRLAGKAIKQITLPEGVRICAVIRETKALIASPELVVQNEDHIIIFLDDKKHIPMVEKLFQVSVAFI